MDFVDFYNQELKGKMVKRAVSGETWGRLIGSILGAGSGVAMNRFASKEMGLTPGEQSVSGVVTPALAALAGFTTGGRVGLAPKGKIIDTLAHEAIPATLKVVGADTMTGTGIAGARRGLEALKNSNAVTGLDAKTMIPKLIAGGILTAAAGGALMNLSSAAKRIGEGKAVRLSTSLRKRPGHSTDINLGIQSFSPSDRKLNPGHPPSLQNGEPVQVNEDYY